MKKISRVPLVAFAVTLAACRTTTSATDLKDGEVVAARCGEAAGAAARVIDIDLTNLKRRDAAVLYAKLAKDLSYATGEDLTKAATPLGIEIVAAGDGSAEGTYQSWFVGRSTNYFVWGVQGTANWTNLQTDLSAVNLTVTPTLLNDKIRGGALHGGFYWLADKH